MGRLAISVWAQESALDLVGVGIDRQFLQKIPYLRNLPQLHLASYHKPLLRRSNLVWSHIGMSLFKDLVFALVMLVE